MSDGLVKLIRSGTRPAVTLALTLAFIAAALHGNQFATTALGGPAGIALAWWFKSRDEEQGK